MEKNVLDYVTEKSNDLINAFSCSAEAKAAAKDWLSAVGTDSEADETRKYIAELEADIMPLDNLIAFAESAQGREYFGEVQAGGVAAHAKELKENGEVYCDCPTCAAVAAILEKKSEMLG